MFIRIPCKQKWHVECRQLPPKEFGKFTMYRRNRELRKGILNFTPGLKVWIYCCIRGDTFVHMVNLFGLRYSWCNFNLLIKLNISTREIMNSQNTNINSPYLQKTKKKKKKPKCPNLKVSIQLTKVKLCKLITQNATKSFNFRL